MIAANIFSKSKFLIKIIQKRSYCDKNLLKLSERGYFKEIFPDNSHSQIINLLKGSEQSIYAGFDPTADSLHIGNLLVLMGLLHCQRAGHNPIALIGGATGQVGDPSGRNTERTQIGNTILDMNLQSLEKQINKIFENHREYFWSNKTTELKPVKILNNEEWYENFNIIEFISTIGRHFRLGQMLSRSSVHTRLQNESGMSFTEFTYQVFQAYDWYYLLKNYNCRFQMGGTDQTGNIMTGHELISRLDKRTVYGLTLPLVTTDEGNKLGKTAGNAIWLDNEKTSHFSFYQFFIRVADSEVEKLLQLFTFLPLNEIKDIIAEHKRIPEMRGAQKQLAKEVTTLVHGKLGFKTAESVTAALYSGKVEALGDLSPKDVQQAFVGATFHEILLEPGINILDVAMKIKCFSNQSDAMRIICAGGFYVNQKRATNINEILSPGIHILKNGLTLFRTGKKNYYIVKWLM